MTTFDSTKASLNDLLKEIKDGKIQLPDFQRGRVWDDDHIRDLLVSLSPNLLRRDEFHQFLEDRRGRLSMLVERAMGKPVSQSSEP